MAQLHCYVPDDIAAKLRQKANHAHLSVSKYLSKLIKKEIETGWPDNYFDIFGSWQGRPLERPEQGTIEERVELK